MSVFARYCCSIVNHDRVRGLQWNNAPFRVRQPSEQGGLFGRGAHIQSTLPFNPMSAEVWQFSMSPDGYRPSPSAVFRPM
jgi:hypothetical protein